MRCLARSTGGFFDQLPRQTFTVDLDSSVLTRYGSQEGSVVGDHPRKRGRPSHHPLMAFVAELRMVAHSWLRPGNASSGNGATVFLAETQGILGKHRIGLLRADAGFVDGVFLTAVEPQDTSDLTAVRLNRRRTETIQGLDN